VGIHKWPQFTGESSQKVKFTDNRCKTREGSSSEREIISILVLSIYLNDNGGLRLAPKKELFTSHHTTKTRLNSNSREDELVVIFLSIVHPIVCL
jgi:hypothetical protein